jgi:creatinine amidohydrolase
MKTIKMEEMTAPEINAAIAKGYSTVVVGVGSTEQHGPHLPTMTDTRIGDELANRVALKLKNALQAKTIAVGISEHHLAFGGTISMMPETLALIIRDYVSSLVRCGFKRIIFLPSHGGNFTSVEKAVRQSQDLYPDIQIMGYTRLLEFSKFLNSLSNEFGITDEESGAHAGENETSMMMNLKPHLVKKEKFEAGYVGPTGEREVTIILEKGMPALTKNGVLGDPSKASADKGSIYLERMTEFLVNKISKD